MEKEKAGPWIVLYSIHDQIYKVGPFENLQLAENYIELNNGEEFDLDRTDVFLLGPNYEFIRYDKQ